MKKKVFLLLVTGVLGTLVYAYNPPVNGELLYQLSTPETLAGAASVAGGGLWKEHTAQISINPALLATEQRIVGNFAYTAVLNTDGTNAYGQSLYFGAVLPSKYGVFTANTQWAVLPLASVPLENSISIRGAYSKDITEKIYVGASLYGGFGTDWCVGTDIGCMYNFDTISTLPFLSDVRWACAITGIGKAYNPDTIGYVHAEKSTTGIPSLTPRTGIAATFLNTKKIKGGLSLDLSFPLFQNILFDCGLQFAVADFLYVNSGWECNLRQTLQDVATYMPFVSVGVKIGFASSENSYFSKKGWSESEIVPSIAYRQLWNKTNVYSAGAAFYLGLPDTEAPVIVLWEE
ncbi:MAG TPA: hypothetical protein VFC68_03445 [Treponemataceae bacterium]|nr:hypothetical protein [Treponemataceae bacterium]